jgi:omega-6 fatty acid desaturase (delta-12 desaturase)
MHSSTEGYRGADPLRSVYQLANTLTPLALLYWAGLYSAIAGNFWWLAISVVCAALIVRTFDLQHDCSHRSFFHSNAANDITGSLLGLVTLTPHACWRRYHNMHHAGVGNLQKRGFGDVKTATVREYESMSFIQRLSYRVYRHPLVLFGIGALIFFVVRQRMTHFIPEDWVKERRSVHLTNLALALLTLIVYLSTSHFWTVIGFHLLVMLMATGAGVWLFYIQHQFPNAYWRAPGDWRPNNAVLDGSSFYDLPRVLHWATANIGYHHIHHADVRIPNYRLPVCHAAQHPALTPHVRFTLLESLGYSRLKLWDEDAGMMVGINDRGRARQRAR